MGLGEVFGRCLGAMEVDDPRVWKLALLERGARVKKRCSLSKQDASIHASSPPIRNHEGLPESWRDGHQGVVKRKLFQEKKNSKANTCK